MLEYFDKLTKKMSWIDVKLVGIMGMCWAMILIKIFPGLLRIHVGWFIVAVIIIYLRILHVLFPLKGDVKKEK